MQAFGMYQRLSKVCHQSSKLVTILLCCILTARGRSTVSVELRRCNTGGLPKDEQVLLHSILPSSAIVQPLAVWLLLYLA